MQTSTVRLYSLPYREAKTYGIALLFVAGNIILPQLFHLIPQGGITWLPIYFFTLIAAYKYGWKVGLLTAVLSPVANALLFGSFARHSHEIGIARHSLRIRSLTVSQSLAPAACRRRPLLPNCGSRRRMGSDKKFFPRRTRLPDRNSRYALANFRRIFMYQLYNS